jgi:hypothetical protein
MLKLQVLKTIHRAAFGVLNAAHGFFETLFRPEGHGVNPLKAELKPICRMLALLDHHIFHVSGLVGHTRYLLHRFVKYLTGQACIFAYLYETIHIELR